jgi:three-Cys-motif partner protein
MDTNQKFGGNWTSEKLGIFSDYLNFYITALAKQKFKKIYIDAFAGTGAIKILNDDEVIEGSARLALNANNKFDQYIFIEKDKKNFSELNQVVQNEFDEFKRIISTRNKDCNTELKQICSEFDWRYNRALLLLDPFATEVKWETLQIVAKTKAIDVWYLFPLGAVQRMMPNNGLIDPKWKARLNTIFGDCGWEQEFYKEDPQMNLFGTTNVVKDINTVSLKEYIYKRLSTIFPAVSSNPRILYNSRHSPLFLFCFAVSSDNPNAIELALRGANYILNKKVNQL